MLLIGRSTHGMMREAADRHCSAKLHSLARLERKLGAQPGPGAPGPRNGERGAGYAAGRGALGSAAATAPPAAGALPEQRRSLPRRGSRSVVLPLQLRLLLLLRFSPGSRSRLQEAGERASPFFSFPLLRSLPANFSRAPTRGAELPGSCGADCRPRAESAVVPSIPFLRPRRAPKRTGPCPGLETEAKPWRDGWALGFWLIDGTVKNEKSDPRVKLKGDDRITLEGSTKEKMNNISILLSNLEFSDTGKYTCHVKNPKENDLQHHATIFLQVVDKLEEVDNTVTLIILAVVGGVIGLLIFILLLKKFITFVLKKTREKKKECLVSSSGNDNTENGLPGSKAEEKPPTKV
uniref:Ig-like domain-containing protein n=2 Tax=Urocitellus parryii TaxID=9999 RepID=A0A8D2H728_UROPR